MNAAPVVNVTELIDSRPLGRVQYLVIGLSSLVVLLDGLNLQSIGLAAPLMTRALHIPPPAFGAVFSAALAGLAIGSVGLGPVADRIGRKPVLAASAFCFGLFTILTARAEGLHTLLVFRFLTGLGLGGAMPSFISLTSEYVPRKLRATYVSLVWTGFPLGGVVGGLIGARLVEQAGWQSIFWVGGVPAILLSAALVLLLPESLGYLVDHGAPPERVRRVLSRVFPDVRLTPDCRFVLSEQSAHGTMGELFAQGRARGTTMLWISYFIAFLMLVTNSAWTPTLLHSVGIEVSRAGVAMAIFNLGSVGGTSVAGFLVARYGALAVLPAAFVGGGAAMGAIGFASASQAAVIVLEGLFGVFIGCASSGLIALAAVFYPISIRSTGVGSAMGIGRFGSFVGPLAVGLIVSMHLGIGWLFLAVGLPAVPAAVAAAFIVRRRHT